MDTIGYLSRGLNRSRTCRLVIILLTLLSLAAILGAYGPHPNVRTLWTYTSTLHQSFVNTTSQPWQLKRPIVNAGSKEANASSSAVLYEPSKSDDFERPEKPDDGFPSEYSMLDGVKVSPPAPPADADNYLAICKQRRPGKNSPSTLSLPRVQGTH